MTDIRVNQKGAIRTDSTGTMLPCPVVRRPSATVWLWQQVKRLTAAWRLWRAAEQTRRALEGLDEATLRDIGLSRGYFGYEPMDGMNRRARRAGSVLRLWR